MINTPNLEEHFFSEINLSDPFFDSLKEDYSGFKTWFNKKSNEKAYVTYSDDKQISGFLYLKVEHKDEDHIDISPEFSKKSRMKIGTFKIDAHGTNLGQYYISKILHEALYKNIDEIYVTIFEKHEGLISLLERYGFKYHGTKNSNAGEEKVYIKDLSIKYDNVFIDYPKFDISKNIYLLSIYPKWHTRLFGDSILKTENPEQLIQDISYTNSIHKVYICGMESTSTLKKGDILVIYRTAEQDKRPFFSSVATSICVVTEYKNISSYQNADEFIRDISRYTVFTADELREIYNNKKYPHIIKMLYNIPFRKRITMKSLMEDCGLSHQGYWGFRKLTKDQFDNIIRLGGVNENFIIN